MPLVILHHLLNVSVQLANKRGSNKKKVWGFRYCEYLRCCCLAITLVALLVVRSLPSNGCIFYNLIKVKKGKVVLVLN
jgi:hypothetical protein